MGPTKERARKTGKERDMIWNRLGELQKADKGKGDCVFYNEP